MRILKKILFWLGWLLIILPILMFVLGFSLTFLLDCQGLNEAGGGSCAVGGHTAKNLILNLILFSVFGAGLFVVPGLVLLAISWTFNFWIRH